MSDSLTDAQKVMAEVAHGHTHSIDFDFCYCGQNFFSGDGITGDGPRDWATHLAVEIDKALGKLTREWGVVVAYPPRPDDGYPGAVVMLDSYRLREAAEEVRRTKYPEDGYELRTRFVGGWTAEEEP